MPARTARPAIGTAALTLGFGASVALWCAAFLTHLPGAGLSGALTLGILIAVWILAAIVGGTLVDRGAAARVGVLSGLLTGALSLLFLGAWLAETPPGSTPAPGFAGLPSSALMAILAVLAIGAAIGAIGALVGSRLGAPAPDSAGPDWLGRFAVLSALTILPLLLVGGAVTTTDSGMAIKGWPDSYGANMFLYPLALMEDANRFLEHTHRLFGTLVGLTTLTLMIAALVRRTPRAASVVAVLVFVLVCAQGTLGGLRVLQDSRVVAMVHGVLAQGVLALAVGLAAMLSRTYGMAVALAPAPGDRRMKFFSTGLLHASILQLIFGAMYRHLRSPHALWTHAGFSLVVVLLAAAAGFALAGRTTGNPAVTRTLSRIGRWLIAAVAVQFLLGWAAFVLVASNHGAESTGEALVRCAHQVNGALLFGLVTLGFVWTRWLLRNSTARMNADGDAAGAEGPRHGQSARV